jgi:DNA-binding NtrC family response regulator
VLVVEDDPFQLRLVERLLCAQGWNVSSVSCAAEAWDVLASQDIMVLLSDHYMPGLTGVEFLGQTRRLYPDVIRVLASSLEEHETVVAAINRAGVFKFLTKPYGPTALRNAMDEAHERARLLRQNARLMGGRVYS